MREAVFVGRFVRQHLVVARDQLDRNSGARLGTRQRMNKDIYAVMAAIGGQTQVGHDEPLAGALAVVVGDLVFRRRRHDIDAGLELAERSIDRERGGDFGIELGRDVEFAAPHLGAALVGQPFGFVLAANCAGNHSPARCRADCGRRCDRSDSTTALVLTLTHWNAALAGARQHIGLAGEAHERFAVAHDRC